MGEIVVNKQMLDDALYSGYKYLENNKLSKGIKYLEFVYNNSKEKDYYLNYALITAYYNIGLFEKSQSILELTDINEIENITIRETLEQIKRELNKEKEETEKNTKDKGTKTRNYISKKEEFSVYNKLMKLLELPGDCLNEIKSLNDSVKAIKSDLIIDFRSFYLYNSIKNSNMYKYLGEYNIYEILTYMNNDEIVKELRDLQRHNYFKLELKALLNSIELFKEFFIVYIEEKNSSKMLGLLAESYRNENDNFFMYQGLVGDVFSDLLEDEEVSSKLKEEIFKYLIYGYSKGIFSKEVFDEVFLESSNNRYKNNYLLYTDVNSEFEKYINKGTELYNSIQNISRNYLYNNIDNYSTFNVKEVVTKLFTYAYFTNKNIKEVDKRILEPFIEKNKEKTQSILKELHKK